MNKKYTDDTFLARWIANNLSKEELEEFKNSEDYHQLKKINDASQLLKAPNYNQGSVFNKITKKTADNKKQTKVLKLKNSWIYSAVASVLLLFSILYINSNQTTSYTTKYGEQITINLPDNSTVNLSPNSNLSFSKKSWNQKRTLNLNGEAYFNVAKGSKFTVNTKEGNVTVLGTKFTVNTSNNFLEVQCFEGSVNISPKNHHTKTITKGNAFRIYDNQVENWVFTQNNPTWLKGESSFNNTPLNKVILSLEKHYNLKFNTSKINTNKRFTGTFTHNNVTIALKTVFAPMRISFKFAENSLVILTPN